MKNPPLLLDVFFGFLFVYGICSDGSVCFFVHFFDLKRTKLFMKVWTFHNACILICLASLSPVLKTTVSIS